MSKKVTMETVARAAGVSRATVSLVARNSPLVSQTTRDEVIKAMEALDYVADLGAARLRSKSSGTVGLVVPNLVNPFFVDFLAGAERAMADDGRVILLANSYDDSERQQAILQRFRSHSVDGVILCPAQGTPETLLGKMADWGLPVIQALREVGTGEADYTGTDSAVGIRYAARHLFERGHRRICFVTVTAQSSTRTERVGAFQQAITDRESAEGTVVETELSLDSAMKAGAEILNLPLKPTGIICFNDIVAAGVMQGMRLGGAEPGISHAIVGFGDLPVAQMTYPQLTTIATNPSNSGASAARMLARRLKSPTAPLERVLTMPTLVVRDSSNVWL